MSLHSHKEPGKALYAMILPLSVLLLTAAVLFAGGFDAAGEKRVALFSSILIFLLCLTPAFRRQLTHRTSIFFLLVSGYVVFAGISTLYAYAPKLAISEYSRVLLAYAVFLTVFTLARRDNSDRVISVFAATSAVLSFLSLDAASWGVAATPVLSFVSRYITGYTIETYGMSYSRINGLFGNSNITAFFCAIGMFLAFYLLLRAQTPRGRILPSVSLYLNSYAFLMCTSLGAISSLGLAILIVLICTKDLATRLSFLVLTLETLFVGILAVLFSLTHFGNESPTGYVVWLCMVGGSVLLWALDWLVRGKLVAFLQRKVKLMLIAFGSLLVVVVAAVILAVFMKTPVTIEGTQLLSRVFYPGAGNCEITIESDGDGTVYVVSVSDSQILLNTNTPLLQGVLDCNISFQVPEDSSAVYLYIYPGEGQPLTISEITYAGAEKSGQIATGYKLIPQSIVTRLQGLRTNQSAMLRFVIMKDGLKMWKDTPIFGRGLAGFANGLPAVQNFYFETKYAHNHYVQCLTDLGLVGLILYMGILVFGFLALWPLRKKEPAGAAFPVLLGILSMVAIHSAIELSMSVTEGLVFAFAGFALIAHHAPSLLPETPKKSRKHRAPLFVSLGLSAFGLLFVVLLGCNLWAEKATESGVVTMELLEKCAKVDQFERNDYLIGYVELAPTTGEQAYVDQAQIYAEKLGKVHSNSLPIALSNFYYTINEPEKAQEMSVKLLNHNRSMPKIWNERFYTFSQVIDPTVAQQNFLRLMEADRYITGYLEIYDMLVETNNRQLDTLLPDYPNSRFIGQLKACEAVGYENTEALANIFQTMVFDSRYTADADSNDLPDNVVLSSGEAVFHADGSVDLKADTYLNIYFYTANSTAFSMNALASKNTGYDFRYPDAPVELLETGLHSTVDLGAIPAEQTAYAVLYASEDITIDRLTITALN